MSDIEVVPLEPGSIDFLPFRPSFHLPLRFTLNTTDPSSSSSPCQLHVDISLPDEVFFDRDESRDALHLFHWTLEPDVIDIERPVKLNEPLSHLHLIPLASFWETGTDSVGEEKKVKIPIHARYLAPQEAGLNTIWLFSGGQSGSARGGWVCGKSSADSLNIDLPLIKTLPLPLTLPTGRPLDQSKVEIGTLAVVWLCFLYLGWKILALSRRSRDMEVMEEKRL